MPDMTHEPYQKRRIYDNAKNTEHYNGTGMVMTAICPVLDNFLN